MFFALDYKREGEFYCGILIFHVTLGNISITQIMASSRRKERQMIMTNWLWHLTYNLFHNKYIHFQAILSAIMMNKNLLDDKGEDQCDQDQHDQEDTPAVYPYNIAIVLYQTT